MKAMPTLQGGLRIDTEDKEDWELLRAIIHDASNPQTDLANRLTGLMTEAAGSEDWNEYVVPDLREGFQDELAQVGVAIETAIFKAGGEAGPIWITPEDAFAWYSSLNQARLAIEEHFHFGAGESINPKGLTEEKRMAFIRSRFYCTIQSLLLDYVMK